MIRKTTIAYGLFTVALFYIITPWFFEKNFLFNEVLVFFSLLALIYKGFRFGRDPVSLCMVTMVLWGMVHLATSIFRMDRFYFFLRNSVIVYSMLIFFLGYYLLPYLPGYLQKARTSMRAYIGTFLFFSLPRTWFERFGVSMLFPALLKSTRPAWVPFFIILVNLIYAFTYDSLTAMVLAFFYLFIFVCPSYNVFRFFVGVALLAFVIVFIYLQPNLALIRHRYNFYNYHGIVDVMNSSPLLNIDGNSTWRLVLWKQIIVDNFPANMFGIGFGTPALRYYPIDDYTKLPTLPYVLGAHNSFVYLFGRLGIIYAILIMLIYRTIFIEYFRFRHEYRGYNMILIFWSFFAVTMIALFNPALESPIYAGAYWLLLGFTARTINARRVADRELQQKFTN